MKTGVCAECGESFQRERLRHPPERTTCGVICRNRLVAKIRKERDISGPKNPAWTGGKLKSQGYNYIRLPGHHRANNHGYAKKADLALEEKIGRLLEKSELAHHINEDKEDDSPGNLEVMTRSAHMSHHSSGQSNPKAILTEKGVKRIRADLSSGDSVREIALRNNVSIHTIYNIRARKTWKHVS